ncbi:autotransporter outer membrane beta-barrel domain-containing protein [Selenomonas timonae]|uniref:Autotransporter outer membrane beta-barrel domain-containing protein n=1 Tax=Selenomonas timonae TaxID=2754044 RepID=A0A7G7VLI1_9FIRM|nr:autotransporter outer membrane beta-barrel domain-containing protein [Selenomonas timonae]QNH54974.1 autotransporter outer membrane beta-barrel domain-containing protein [Selenomonas timonae]
MKHHSQRSKRPPSRTLAPRILAALTAGAVTLGALPYAYADPIVASSVTSDMVTEDGVAGSIDGSSATITVGRTGDGDTPRLQRATPSEWSFAYGTYLKSSVPLANIHITNGKAIVRSGTLHDAVGTYIELMQGGTARVENSTAEASGGTFLFNLTQVPSLTGGEVSIEGAGTHGVAEVVRSHATFTGGTFGSIQVSGGRAFSENDTRAEALVEENTATFTGGNISRDGLSMTGGYAYAESLNTAAAKALRNRLTVHTPTGIRSFDLVGGQATTSNGSSRSAQANENVINAKTSVYQRLIGGFAWSHPAYSTSVPAPLSTTEANRNKIWIAAGSGEFTGRSVCGWSELNDNQITELRGAANENEFSIGGGTLRLTYGGMSQAVNSRTGADSIARTEANKNKVWSKADTLEGDLLGGSALAWTTDGRAEAAAHENELYVKGGTYQQNVYSGSATAESENGSAVAQATKNYLSTETNVMQGITGGHASAEAKGTFDVLASENLLSLRGGARSFIGGYAEGTQRDSGTYVLQSTGTANENSMEIRSTGTFTDKSAGGYVHITANNTKLLSAAAARNEVLLQDGTFNEDVAGGRSFARNTTTAADSVTNAAANENTVHALGGTYGAGLYGGSAYAEAKREFNASANKNKLAVSAGAKNFIGGYAEGKQLAPGESVTHSTAEANENKVWVGAGAGTFTDKSAAGYSTIETNNVAEPKAEANSNQLTIRAGTFREDVTSGRSFARNTSTGSAANAVDNRLWVYGGTTRFQRHLFGGSAEARAAGNNSAEAEASGNITHLMEGTAYDGDVYGGMAQGGSDTGNVYLKSNYNELYIHGGTYRGNIYAGAALGDPAADPNDVHEEVHDNKIVISGANDLSFASLYGYRHRVGGGNAHAADNELVLKNTKNITVKSVQGFNRFAFYVPSDITEDDTMLYVRDDTQDIDLSGKTVDAYLQGSTSLPNRIRLLHTVNAEIHNDGTATMTVHEGISGTERISVTTNKKELIVRRDGGTDAGGPVPVPSAPKPDDTPLPSGATPPTPPGSPSITPPGGIVTPPPTPPALPPETPYDGGFRLRDDHAKSLAETMAGSVAFIGSGMNLFTGLAMSSASIEAAAAEGFAPFAAMSGSSMRIATGSHVDLKGMNLAVGFSREVKRDDNRLIFGPIVEYGRGTYDSYVNAVHGDGSIRYIGAGGFIRQEQKDGMFYEGSLRAGRSNMNYGATLNVGGTPRHTSYDTRANYIGAHLGVGQSTAMKDGGKQEVYVRYFYTRQNGTDATLSTGDRYSFSAVDSHILRTGARWMHPQKSGSLIVGASVQYEFGGDASATYHRAGGMSYTSPSPSLKGVSASVELGWKTQMSANSTADLSVEGWTGKQRGVNFRAGFAWQF